MDAEDLELFRTSLQAATGRHTGEALDAALDELGWSEALAEDPRAAISVLFDLQGRAHATSSALDRVVATHLGLGDGSTTSVVLPKLGGYQPPATGTDTLSIDGFALAGLARAESALVVSGSPAGKLTVAVVGTADLTTRPVQGVDPQLGALEVTGEGVAVRETTEVAPGAWADAVAVGQLALAHELVGVSRTMLALAREHALERVQFGVAISTFQAVRHRLAEALIAIETADSMATAAWDDPSALTASVAKSVAGRGARTAARHCQQVLAGIGFTTEHDFHLHLRRFLVLDQLLGSTQLLTRELGQQLLRDRAMPAILPL